MMGLTRAEYEHLRRLASPEPMEEVRDGEPEHVMNVLLTAQGRASERVVDHPEYGVCRVWSISPLGRLAVLLWPSNAA